MFKTSLNICMIVKNEAKNLELTLPNFVAAADRVIIIDTGSTDGTKKVAESLGAEVFDFAWCDDFSAARNESIKRADSDWIAWFDADEYLETKDLERLRSRLDACRSNVVHLVIKECEYGAKESKNSYFRDKVFRNRLGIRFERPINEQVTCKDKSLHTIDKLEDVEVFHWGRHLTHYEMLKKNTERTRIFEEVASKNPNDPMYFYLLGLRRLDLERFKEAEEAFDNAINLCEGKTGPERFIKEGAHLTKAWTYYRFQNYKKAISEALRAIEANPENAEPYCVAAGSYLSLCRPADALPLAEKSVNLAKKQHPMLTVNDIAWDVMRFMFYANCLVSEKRYIEAIPHLETVLMSHPENESAANLLELIKQGVKECKV